MAEHCIYGGLLVTRMEVYKDLAWMMKRTSYLFVDKMVWTYPVATPEQIEFFNSVGHTFAAFKASGKLN